MCVWGKLVGMEWGVKRRHRHRASASKMVKTWKKTKWEVQLGGISLKMG